MTQRLLSRIGRSRPHYKLLEGQPQDFPSCQNVVSRPRAAFHFSLQSLPNSRLAARFGFQAKMSDRDRRRDGNNRWHQQDEEPHRSHYEDAPASGSRQNRDGGRRGGWSGRGRDGDGYKRHGDDERRHRKYRSRSRSRDRDRDRDRDRSRDRRDRKRSRSPGAAREGERDAKRRDRYHDRDREEERDSGRRRDRGRDPKDHDWHRQEDRADSERLSREPETDRDRTEDGGPRSRGMQQSSLVLLFRRNESGMTDHFTGMYSGSDQKQPTKNGDRGTDRAHGHERDESRESDLPTRLKADKPARASPAPMSFRVGTVHDRDGHDENSDARERGRGRGRDRSHDRREQSDEDMEVDDELVVADDGADAMAAMMGFSGFDTTKGKKIPGNNLGAVRKEKKTEYRQYMNRNGGFNRPLSPSR
jgi:U4/U6.U5 tri-snRNP-associated protein 3